MSLAWLGAEVCRQGGGKRCVGRCGEEKDEVKPHVPKCTVIRRKVCSNENESINMRGGWGGGGGGRRRK